MRNSSIDMDEVNYAKAALSEAAILDIVAKAGSVAAVMNARHTTAKDKGWADTPPSAGAFAKAVVAEPNLLKRPILVDGDRVIVGFNRTAYAGLTPGGAASKAPAAAAKSSARPTKTPAAATKSSAGSTKKPAAKKPAAPAKKPTP